MSFNYAYEGIKKLFVGLIIEVVISIMYIVADAIHLQIISSYDEILETTYSVIYLISSIIYLLALIIQFIGLYQGGKDEDLFKKAFWTYIGILLIDGLTVGLIYVPNIPNLIISLLNTLLSLAAIFAVFFITEGIISLATELNEIKIANFGRVFLGVAISLFMVSTLLNLAPAFFADSEFTVELFAIIESSINVLLYTSLTFYVGRSLKMLKLK